MMVMFSTIRWWAFLAALGLALAAPAVLWAQPEDPPAPAAAFAPAPAAAEGDGPAAPSMVAPLAPRHGLDMLKAFAMFIVVLALLFLTLKALGRFSRFRAQSGRHSVFDLKGVLPLDNRKYLAAVEVDGRFLVVGVTQDRITAVAHWPLKNEDAEGQGDEPPFSLGDEEGDFPPDIDISNARGGGFK